MTHAKGQGPRASPRSTASRVWLDQFNGHLLQWLQSGRSDDQPLLQAAGDLKNLLSTAPESAGLARSFALGAAFSARRAAGPEAVSRLVDVGNNADLLQAEQDPESSSARVLLNLYLAEAYLWRRSQYNGLDALARAEQLMQQHASSPRLIGYLEGYRWYLRGALSEVGLAFEQAAGAYAKAAETLDPMVRTVDGLADSTAALLELLFGTSRPGDKQQSEQVFLLAAGQIRIIASLNALGRIRATSMTRPTPGLERLAFEAWETVFRAGAPDDAGPLDVFPLVVALPKKAARECAAMFADRVGGARGDRPAWEAIFFSARLSSTASKPSADRARWKAALRAALPKVNDPLVLAFARSRILLAGVSSRRRSARATTDFLASLRMLVHQPLTPLDQLRVRALFDEPLAACVDWARREFEAAPGALHRTRLAVLLDALRGSALSELAAVPEDAAPASGTPEAGLLPALDRLQRIAHALREYPDAMAIVLQRQAEGYLLVCVTGDKATPIVLIDAGPEFETAARGLYGKVQKILGVAALTGDFPGDDAVTPFGRAAYDALPEALQDLIAARRTLLIVPDYRADTNDIPFELFHDGKAHLGTSRVLARFTSLRSLTRAVEHLSRRLPRKRALVASASRVEPPWPELPLSRQEVERVHAALAKTHWDAPLIEEPRLSAKLLADHLEDVSWMHISAHGDVAVDEAIVLPAGERFTTDDLLRKRYPWLPAAYLNTCSLGQARYVGGGISRGIAHTLVDAGAPVAIANLLPIEDGAASDLALEFYAQARRHPVGDALRLARGRLAKRGVHPILWGTTVLTGDPWVMLEPGVVQRSLTDQLLDAYFSLAPDQRSREARRLQAVASLVADPGNVRLQAAVQLLRWAGAVTSLATPREGERWSQVIRLADEVDHMPAMALLRFVQVSQPAPELEPAERSRQIDEAVRHLEAMSSAEAKSSADRSWRWLLHEANAVRNRTELEAAMKRTGKKADGGGDEQDKLQPIADALRGAYATQAAANPVTEREPERDVDDVVWNAVVMGHGNRFEGMPQVFSAVKVVATKLQALKALPTEAMPYAPVVLSGFLNFIWRSQNVMYIAPEMAEGWAGALKVAAAELARDWAPPTHKPWFARLAEFPRAVDAAVKKLEDCTYEEVYDHLDPEMNKLQSLAKGILVHIRAKHGPAVAGATGWMMGTIIEKNTFSPLDGSVPEDFDNRLTRIYNELERDAEGGFWAWLEEGSRPVRERPLDELQRWKADIEPEQKKPKKAPRARRGPKGA